LPLRNNSLSAGNFLTWRSAFVQGPAIVAAFVADMYAAPARAAALIGTGVLARSIETNKSTITIR
jgi:hypothetical protein